MLTLLLVCSFSPKVQKYLLGSPITALLTKQTHFIRLFVFCLFIPFPHGYTVSRGAPVNFAFEITLFNNAISKDYNWKAGVPATKVVCKGGTISI